MTWSEIKQIREFWPDRAINFLKHPATTTIAVATVISPADYGRETAISARVSSAPVPSGS
jgi:hypothetical protein